MTCVGIFVKHTTLYALCIETKVNFVNQSKGKITLIIFPWGRVSLAISLRSGSSLERPLKTGFTVLPTKAQVSLCAFLHLQLISRAGPFTVNGLDYFQCEVGTMKCEV